MMLSIIGRTARIIQAHMYLSDKRLKVRYSQLFDFSYHTPVQRDLFLRWLLSDPIAAANPLSDGGPTIASPGESAAQTTAIAATGSSRSTDHLDEFPKAFASMSTGAPIPVA